jgi:choline dehydrogenase-like flavoprotein
VSGQGLGGGTVINYSTCFRTPAHVRDEWAGLGAAQFASDEFDHALDAVWQRLGVNGDHSRAARRDAVLERGLTALGWQVGTMTRNVIGCDQDVECGRCGWGCRIGAKQSVARTWLVDAQSAGARIFTGVDVRRIIADGADRGIEGVTAAGHRVRVHARAVVVAGGTLQTPAILRRSGLGNANVGRYLRLHPVGGVWSRYDEEILPWTGGMQTRYSTQFGDLDGDGYGVLLETAPFTPGFVAGLTPWRGAQEHRELMGALGNSSAIAVITRDRDSGEIKVGKDGEPTAHYKLSARDGAHLKQGMAAAIRISEAAGARHVLTGHASMPQWRRESGETIDTYISRVDALGHRPGELVVASLHIMGTARMGGDQATSATNPDGEVWGTSNLVVADASCFPTAPGINPMVSIEAIARMNALRLAARLS